MPGIKKVRRKLYHRDYVHFFNFNSQILGMEKCETDISGELISILHIGGKMIDINHNDTEPINCIILIEKTEWIYLFNEYCEMLEKLYQKTNGYFGFGTVWVEEFREIIKGPLYFTESRQIKEQSKKKFLDSTVVNAYRCSIEFDDDSKDKNFSEKQECN